MQYIQGKTIKYSTATFRESHQQLAKLVSGSLGKVNFPQLPCKVVVLNSLEITLSKKNNWGILLILVDVFSLCIRFFAEQD